MRGGSLFARRETGLLAKALLRPGGLSRLLSDPRRIVAVGLVDEVVVGLATARAELVGETSSAWSTPFTWTRMREGSGSEGRCSTH